MSRRLLQRRRVNLANTDYVSVCFSCVNVVTDFDREDPKRLRTTSSTKESAQRRGNIRSCNDWSKKLPSEQLSEEETQTVDVYGTESHPNTDYETDQPATAVSTQLQGLGVNLNTHWNVSCCSNMIYLTAQCSVVLTFIIVSLLQAWELRMEKSAEKWGLQKAPSGGSRGQRPRWRSGGEAPWSFLTKIRRQNCIKQPCIFQFCQFLTWCKTITF